MNLNVPFYKQTTKLNCGPTALRMVLSFFGKDPGIKILEEKTGIKEGKAIYTIQIATAAALLGYRAEFFAKSMEFNPEYLKFDFYKKYSDVDAEKANELVVEEAKNAGVRIEEKSLSLKEILSKVTENSIPIILLNWKVLEGKEDYYQGHFVPIVGYDEENIYVHNQDPEKPQEFLAIKRKLFDKARKAEGTDEDIAIIYRK